MLRTWTSATLLMVLAACGTQEPPAETENEMTSSQKTPPDALADAKAASKDLLTVLFPDRKVTVVGTNAAVPCGGFVGSEYSKIHYDFEAGLKPAADDARLKDVDALFDEAGSAMRALGLKVVGEQVTTAGRGLVFGGDGFGGKLLLHVEGAVMIHGQTGCLDNPDELR